MNNNDIETISVLTVKESLINSGFLEPFINENDKQPSWDGYVNIYSKKEKTKTNLTGRMSVQVKGTIKKVFDKKEITYTTSKVDLQNYLYDGGIIYFVVYISEDGSQKKIYYAELPPIKLRNIIKKIKNKKKNIRLYEFPNDPADKATIFLNCYNHCQKQASYAKAILPTIEELKSSGLLESITTTVSGYGLNKDNLIQFFLKNKENYFYANIKGSSIPQPLDFLSYELAISNELKIKVSVNGKLYYTKLTQIFTDGITTNIIGGSLKISVNTRISEINIKYKDSQYLRVLAKDLEFFLDVINADQMEFDGNVLSLKNSNPDFSNFNITKQKKRLSFSKKIIRVLDCLNASDDFDLSSLSDREKQELDHLITAFVDKKPVKNLKQNLPPILSMKILDYKFYLIFKPLPEKSTTYNIHNFFSEKIDIFSKSGDGSEFLDSQYSILTPDDFLNVTNIKYNVLLPSYQNLDNNEYKYAQANNTLLKLLLAYDSSQDKKPELLQTAEEFSEWLLESADTYLSENVRLLNRLQVLRRQRELTTEEKDILLHITESTDREDEKVGAFLLLNYQEAAKNHFNKLDSNLQNTFRTYPIFKFADEIDNK